MLNVSINFQDIEMKGNSEIKKKGCNSVANLRKMNLYNPNLDIINVNVYTKFAEILPLVLKILSGNEILTSIKGRNSVANLQNLTFYNPNLDHVNVNVYTIFLLILSIGSQDIERKPCILTTIKGRNTGANLQKQ